jgi:hypothetical protein
MHLDEASSPTAMGSESSLLSDEISSSLVDQMIANDIRLTKSIASLGIRRNTLPPLSDAEKEASRVRDAATRAARKPTVYLDPCILDTQSWYAEVGKLYTSFVWLKRILTVIESRIRNRS